MACMHPCECALVAVLRQLVGWARHCISYTPCVVRPSQYGAVQYGAVQYGAVVRMFDLMIELRAWPAWLYRATGH
jgi:hypothetical protein